MSRTIDVDTKTFVRFWLVILAFVLIHVLLSLTAFKELDEQPLDFNSYLNG